MDQIKAMRSLLSKPHYVREGFRPIYFYPDEDLNSLADINPQHLVDCDIEGLVIDVDQTVIDGYADLNVSRKIEPYYNALQDMFVVCHLSNAESKRLNKLENILKYKIVRPKKPKPSYCAFRTALNYLKLPAEKVAMVGDLIYIDISAANRLGFYTIKVKPLAPEKDPFSIKMWRKMENWLRKKYNCSIKEAHLIF